ncbi:hypothetical protein FIBSPDRAFT_932499 [Athelia psychrophila]|uniref:Actin-like ATPase domain-containing protein n=1 Tax=Athelia psychrophila TaxID=1759441 RepID=A0A166IQE6_9AGAM|nr:hypothetical protein FIBSPDRAFT_932499 [Fibularhizoctonia sp. CBS 109695]
MASSRLPYHGSERKLVLGMDIGTTFSGISYAVLDPGEVPTIRGVTRFPAQENVGGDSKIPSIIYYDRQGKVRAVGAEALQESIIEQAEDDDWVKLEWWKLHLRPKRLASSHVSDSDLPALPPNKSAVEVLGDFMNYLLRCAQKYITDTYSESWWNSVANNIDFVLTHPNGWEGAQQSEIRRAAVLAGLVSDTLQGQSRIQLLTEGEASLHYCIEKGLTFDDTTGIIILDAGGGTIDLSAYHKNRSPVSFEEIAPTECRLQGSVFVSRRARVFLRAKLANSNFSSPEDLNNLVDCFDKSTKLRFRNKEEPSYIKFGGVRDKDPTVGIRSGQLKMPGTEVAALFEPSIKEILSAVDQQIRVAKKPIKSVFLVGGFAASDWLFSQLQQGLSSRDVECYRPDSHVNKAVAEGAISFYLDHRVSARVSRKTYGSRCNTVFIPYDPEHQRRSHAMHTSASGENLLPDVFDIILPKGTTVSEEQEFRRPYILRAGSKAGLNKAHGMIRSYEGSAESPKWTDVEPDNFPVLCTIEADTSKLSEALKPQNGLLGQYYSLDYSLVLLFGLTELKVQICWKEHGVEMRSPARVVYDIDETISDV